MTNSVQQALGPLIIEQAGDEGLFDYVDAVAEAIELQASGLEEIRIQRDRVGNVVVATTRKLPNLRFRLGDLLLEATGSGMAIAGSLDKPLALVLAGIRFLRAIGKLATLDIRKEDAEMLLAIFQVAQEEGVVRVDDLPAAARSSSGWGRHHAVPPTFVSPVASHLDSVSASVRKTALQNEATKLQILAEYSLSKLEIQSACLHNLDIYLS